MAASKPGSATLAPADELRRCSAVVGTAGTGKAKALDQAAAIVISNQFMARLHFFRMLGPVRFVISS